MFNRPVWVDLLRPSAITMAVVAGVLLGLLGAGGRPSLGAWEHILLSTVLLAAVVIGADTTNFSYEAYQEDALHQGAKQDRPIPAGMLSGPAVLSSGVILWLLADVVSSLFFPAVYTALLVLLELVSWIYSAPPHLKSGTLSNSFGIWMPRSILGPACAFVAGGGSLLSPTLWWMWALTTPAVLLAGEVRNLGPDALADAMALGPHATWTVRYGDRAGVAMTLAGFLIVPVEVLPLVPGNPFLLLLWVPTALALVGFRPGHRWPYPRLHRLYHYSFSLGILLYCAPTVLHFLGGIR